MANELKKTGSVPAATTGSTVTATAVEGAEKKESVLSLEEQKTLTQMRKFVEMIMPAVVTHESPVATICGFDMLFPMYKQNAVYKENDIRTNPTTRQPHRCVIPYDGNVQTAWNIDTGTVWYKYHGTSKESAYPFCSESHNPYKPGEFCEESGGIFRNKEQTTYAPSVLPDKWEKVE